MNRLRIGILGAGGIARIVHLPALAGIEGAELRALCDYVPGLAEDELFIQTVLANPQGSDPDRTAEDYSSMELAEDLLKARIKKVEFPC